MVNQDPNWAVLAKQDETKNLMQAFFKVRQQSLERLERRRELEQEESEEEEEEEELEEVLTNSQEVWIFFTNTYYSTYTFIPSIFSKRNFHSEYFTNTHSENLFKNFISPHILKM